MRKTIQQILIDRDGKTGLEAQEAVCSAKAKIYELIEKGRIQEAYRICQERFGLDPDKYVVQLLEEEDQLGIIQLAKEQGTPLLENSGDKL